VTHDGENWLFTTTRKVNFRPISFYWDGSETSPSHGMKERVKRAHFFLLCLWLMVSQAWAISYTVQVAAFSDEATAKRTWQELLDLGFPAYLISAPTGQGQIYRIRVGTFGNRDAATLFAEAMQGVVESNPSPALAENILLDNPFQASLLGRYDLKATLLQVFPWGEALALRIQPRDASEQALYKIDDLEFLAWRAVLQEDGWIIRMYSFPVWDPAVPDATPEAREQYRAVVLANIADQLGLTPKQVAAFEFNADAKDKPPYLVLVERWNPQTQQRELLKAIGQESSKPSAYGPELVLFQGEEVTIPLPEDQLFEPKLDMSEDDVLGETWQALSDGDYIKLKTEDPEKEWRVAIGQPIWASQDLLLASYKEQLLVYRLGAVSP
jgi:SPOR domain